MLKSVDVCDDNDNDSNNNNKVGATALIAAARNGHSAVVTLLCNRGANVNATTSSVSGYSYLCNMYIDMMTFRYACQTFLKKIASSKDNTALREAIGEREVEVVKILLGRGALMINNRIEVSRELQQ